MIRDILVGIVRQLLAVAFGGAIGWLTAHGAATNGQLELLLAVLAGVIVNLVWSVGERLVKRWHLETALALPPGAGDRLAAISRATPLGVKLSEAITGRIVDDPERTPQR